MKTEAQSVVLENGSQEEAENETIVTRSPREAKAEANKITNRRTLYAAGIGLIPFPAVDAALVLGIQVWMIRDIAKVYDVEYNTLIYLDQGS